ncbi:MAG: hypothetical protein GXX96_30660 [Planctomycetaceae bacterium]|jgi:hypothetical protein|nr:hypothetical protein [Planctomycetaceae bacterium]
MGEADQIDESSCGSQKPPHHSLIAIESLDAPDIQRSGCLLIVGHLLITCALGPTSAVVAWSLVCGNWQILTPSNLLGSLFAFLFFGYPFLLPFCVLTWLGCALLHKLHLRSVFLWAVGGALIGVSIALFYLLFATWPKGPSAEEGTAIGLASGVLLRWLWIPRRS